MPGPQDVYVLTFHGEYQEAQRVKELFFDISRRFDLCILGVEEKTWGDPAADGHRSDLSIGCYAIEDTISEVKEALYHEVTGIVTENLTFDLLPPPPFLETLIATLSSFTSPPPPEDRRKPKHRNKRRKRRP